MRTFPSDVAFTPAVKAVQQARGSRESYARMEKGRGWRTTVTPDLADFGGNQQYVTLGNLSENPRAFLFLMDYANSRRIKVWGTARVVDGDAALLEKLHNPEYPGEAERAILFAIEAWDVNCPQHIHRRFSERQVAPVIEELKARIAELEAEVARLQLRRNKPQGA